MTSRLQRSFLPWIIFHAFEFKWFYLGAVACLYVLQSFQAQLPARIRGLTQLLSIGELAQASIWVFLGLAVGILIFRTLSRLLFFYPARVQQKLLRMELLGKLESVPASRYAHRNQGQIFQILFDDINQIRAFVGFGLLQIGNLIIAGFVLIPKVNETDAYLWPAFIPLFFSVVLFSIMTFINERFFKRMMEKKGEVQQYIIESYQAKQTIKNFHREENFIQGFIQLSQQELGLFFKSSVGFAVTGPYIKLGLGASLLWASMLIRARGGSPSDLVFFSGFLYLFLEPVMFMSWVAVVISQGFAAWRRSKDLSDALDTPQAEERELADATFQLQQDHYEAAVKFWGKDILLQFKPSCWTVLVGETGSGKSFLLSRLATLMILRGLKVSMVQQEPYLFNDTMEQNIFLGAAPDAAARQKARDLICMFQLESLAENLDEVLKLEVGENGKRLSGGQMKRVALIRSLISGADVLMWDDPFSSVDIISEKKIIQAIRGSAEWGQKTFLISGHRLTTVRMCDQVLLLDAEQGIKLQGRVDNVLKDANAIKFFKEQMVDISLA
jgi:ABC-type multidrug transport system fused ATPase/permease subunit